MHDCRQCSRPFKTLDGLHHHVLRKHPGLYTAPPPLLLERLQEFTVPVQIAILEYQKAATGSRAAQFRPRFARGRRSGPRGRSGRGERKRAVRASYEAAVRAQREIEEHLRGNGWRWSSLVHVVSTRFDGDWGKIDRAYAVLCGGTS